MAGAMKRRNVAKVKRNGLKKKAQNRYDASGKARILYQGVAAPPRRNFGSMRAKANLRAALDARIPRTLGLPRAVGPYTVIRTTIPYNDPDPNSEAYIFCPFLQDRPAVGSELRSKAWLSWCGVRQSSATGGAIGGTGSISPIVMPTFNLGGAAEVVPSAMTVQVMNSQPVQSADGIFLMGRMNQQLPFGNSTKTWGEFRTEFSSYFSPRLLSGGKLALRGVKCDSYPLDMSEYSTFAPVSNLITDKWSADIEPAALAPIVFVRNQANGPTTNVTFLITIEWRVRFDPLNPVFFSHTYHDTLSDEAWNTLVGGMSAAGHGVEELAEDAVEAGAMGVAARAAIALL